MLSIGNFSKISNVSTKTLRYYDEIGLLNPIHINTENGYRYYDVSQLEIILLINKLKLYVFSLEEIAEVLKNRHDDALLFSLLRQKKQAILEKMDALHDTMAHLENDIDHMERGRDIMAYLEEIKVKLVELKPQTVIWIRETINVEDIGTLIGRLCERAEKENLTTVGAPITIYYDAEFNPAHTEVEVALPVKEVVTGTREFYGGLCVMSSLKGPYSEIPSVHARLNAWMEEEGYSYANPPFEVYVTDPHKTQPNDNVTEVYIPVKK